LSSKKLSQLARNIQQNPNDSFSKFALALELLKRDQVEKSLRLFESVYNNDPDYIGVYYHLGKLYQQIERNDDAQTVFQEGMQRAKQLDDQHTYRELHDALQQLKEDL
jgi:Tfp pilus assembly protein PilF